MMCENWVRWEGECEREEMKEKKKTKLPTSDGFSTYRNRITKMVLTFAITQHTADVEFRRIIVVPRSRFLHDG